MAKLILSKPIELGKITVSELTFRDYTISEDYLSFDVQGGVAQRIQLIANMSGNEPALIKKMSGRDYQKAVAIVDSLLDQDLEPEGSLEKKSSASPLPKD